MTAPLPKKFPLPRPEFPVVDNAGRAVQTQFQWQGSVDAVVSALNGGGAQLVNAANDAAAQAAGVQLGSLYRNGSILMIRVV